MSDITLTIDGQKVTAQAGQKVLFAALDAGIYIPHLCAMKEIDPPLGSCRLCFVEIEGYASPMTSCSVEVQEGMVVTTRSDRVDRLVATGFEFLMSAHDFNCKQCPANKNCALQEIIKQRKFKGIPKRVKKLLLQWPIDDSRSDFGLNPNRCVLCGRCVWMCNEKLKTGTLDFLQRGLKTVIGTFDNRPLAEHECKNCLACVDVCPVGALYRK